MSVGKKEQPLLNNSERLQKLAPFFLRGNMLLYVNGSGFFFMFSCWTDTIKLIEHIVFYFQKKMLQIFLSFTKYLNYFNLSIYNLLIEIHERCQWEPYFIWHSKSTYLFHVKKKNRDYFKLNDHIHI